MSSKQVMPFVIDTDVDIDDWMAMLYLLNHPNVEVRGITVVGTGACHLDPGARNALNILMIPDKGDIPVAKGLSKPMKYNHQFPADIRQPVDDLYGIHLPPQYHNPREPLPDAIAFLDELLSHSKEPINILAIGPLTNLGTLLQQKPELAKKIARIFIMGGAIEVPGNIHAADPSNPNITGEWNIYLDPVAAEIVFNSGAPISLVPLDSTADVPVTEKFYLRIMQNHLTPSATFVYDSLIKDFGFLRSGNFYFWDPLAALVGTNPDLGFHQPMRLKVETRNNVRSGQLLPDDEGALLTVYFGADAPRFYDLFLNTLNGTKTYKNSITFILDGEQITLDQVDPRELLIDYLHRPEVNKTGTRLVCGEGGCGACTVMMTSYDHGSGKVIKRAINSCLRPLCSLDGTMITTTQGIGSVKTAVDQTQYTVAANNGSQCGYCTPGFVMNMFTLLQNNPEPSVKEIEDLFDGNICRCTGYRPILEGFKKLGKDYVPPPHQGEICIEQEFKPAVKPYSPLDPPRDFLGYMADPQPVNLAQGNYTYYRPTSLAEVYRLKGQFGGQADNFRLLSGNTITGIFPTRPYYRERTLDPKVIVDVSSVGALQEQQIGNDGLTVGCGISINQLLDLLAKTIATRPDWETRGLSVLQRHLEVVANNQVRNVGTLGGNLFMAVNLGFLSDLIVVLRALGAIITVSGSEGSQTYDLGELPKNGQLPTDSVYHSLFIPYTNEREWADSFKIRARHEDCHAIVNAAFRVNLTKKNKIRRAWLVYNGLDATYKHNAYGAVGFSNVAMPETSGYLEGKQWNNKTLQGALKVLEEEVSAYTPPKHRKQSLQIDEVPWSYRANLALNLFYKFFVNVALQVCPDEVAPENRSAGENYERGVSFGEQYYNSYPDELPVSKPLVKLSAFAQATGEAKYSHDMERPPGTLEAAYVYSLAARGGFYYQLPVTTAHGQRGQRVSAAQLSEFLCDWSKGFRGYITYSDIAEENQRANWIGFGGDDPIFVPSMDDTIPKELKRQARDGFHPHEVTCIGAPIGLIVAQSQQQARDIAVFVRNHCIVYEEKKAIFTMDQAIEARSFYRQSPPYSPGATHISEITKPGSDQAWLHKPDAPSDGGLVTGVQSTGAQNHFYLETMATLADPGESQTMTLYTSTQTLADNQSAAAGLLGVSSNDVQIVLRRDGGAYGGKQSRSNFNSTATALAAATLRKPIRLVLDRHTNFIMCGNRHPVKGDFAVAYDKAGMIRAARFDFYSNGGNTYDLSFPVMDLSMMSADNSYQVETFKTTGKVCRTNLISNTAFRSFGTIQSVNVTEEAIERVAHELGVSAETVRERNLYRNGNYHWKGFQVTQLTLDVLAAYKFRKRTLERLATLQGQTYDNQKSFEAAVTELCPDLDSEELLMVDEYSNTSYDFTPYLQGLKYCDVRQIWESLKISSNYENRAKEVEAFNKQNRWRKRGICMIPLKYGVSYTGPRGTLNQGGAYIVAYQVDGSVLVQHGGVESGQGIQTKMAQIAAETLDIPLDLIRMGDTTTAVIPDASPTAASTGSDLNGGAVQQACQLLRARLEKFCEDLEQYTVYFSKFDPTKMDVDTNRMMQVVVNNWRERWSEVWPMIISLAYVNRIDLTAGTRYKTPHYSAVDLAHPFGSPFFYFTYSAACTEIELDVLTGDFDIRRTDILYDTGKSLNPLIDVGQIEGAFVQGAGCLTTERMTYQGPDQAPLEGFPEGAMTSVGTWQYKPPGSKSIPQNFQVRLVDNHGKVLVHKGPRLDAAAVKSSKGIGEPPLVLGNTVFFAIKRAIRDSLAAAGKPHWPGMDAPASIDRIQLACETTREQLTL